MAEYTIIGHPLNPSDLAVAPGEAVDDGLLSALRDNGVGIAVEMTLDPGEVTEAAGVIQ